MTDSDDVVGTVIRQFRNVIQTNEMNMGAIKTCECLSDALRNEAGQQDSNGNVMRANVYYEVCEAIDTALIEYTKRLREQIGG